MKCTDLLIQDHKAILRALDVLGQMAKRVEEHQALEHDDVEVILRFLRSFADEYHQGKEESALFPELRRTQSAQEPAVRQMLFEHDQERSLVEASRSAFHEERTGICSLCLSVYRADPQPRAQRRQHSLRDRRRSVTAEQDEKVVAEFAKIRDRSPSRYGRASANWNGSTLEK